MTFRIIPCVIVVLGILSVPANAQEKMYSDQDLNELMAKVWQNCKIDLDNLRGYIFNEKDTNVSKKWFPDSGSRTRSEDSLYYVWTAKDGYLRPSLTRINGKEVSIDGNKIRFPKEKYSVWDPNILKWYVKQRQNHQKWEKWDTILDFFDDQVEGWSKDRIYARFDYKPRKYRYAGTREYEGHRGIEITYPSQAEVGSGSTLVRMLVIPDENQLVAVALTTFYQYGFGQAQKDCTMTLDNSYDNVWLPKEFRQNSTSSWGGVVSISREFTNYAKTGLKAKFWFEDVKTRMIWYDLEKPEATK